MEEESRRPGEGRGVGGYHDKKYPNTALVVDVSYIRIKNGSKVMSAPSPKTTTTTFTLVVEWRSTNIMVPVHDASRKIDVTGRLRLALPSVFFTPDPGSLAAYETDGAASRAVQSRQP
jgi:hypothetical protein